MIKLFQCILFVAFSISCSQFREDKNHETAEMKTIFKSQGTNEFYFVYEKRGNPFTDASGSTVRPYIYSCMYSVHLPQGIMNDSATGQSVCRYASKSSTFYSNNYEIFDSLDRWNSGLQENFEVISINQRFRGINNPTSDGYYNTDTVLTNLNVQQLCSENNTFRFGTLRKRYECPNFDFLKKDMIKLYKKACEEQSYLSQHFKICDKI